MKVAALQLDIVWEDRQANYSRVEELAEEAVRDGAELLVLPEMFATGFSLDTHVTAEPEGGETAVFLSQLAKRLSVAVIAGVVLNGASGKGRNTALVYDNKGREVARYAKTHLFSFVDEQRHHEPGHGPVTFELNGMNAACFICFDLRFPELFRLIADIVDVVFIIASWPEARQRHWNALLPARAIENQCYVIGVNRVGHGNGLDYKGGTAAYGPQGELLASAAHNEEIVFATIEPSRVAETRQAMPFLADRRFRVVPK